MSLNAAIVGRINQGSGVGDVHHGTDQNLFVEFVMVAVRDNYKSEKEGREIFSDVPHVRIITPGDNKSEFFQPVRDIDKKRFARQWEEFERTGQTAQTGTPLEMWPILSPAQVATFKALSIYTVEQLAGLTDVGLQKCGMGARDLQKKAKAFIDAAENTALIQMLDADNKRKDEQLAAMQLQIDELNKAIAKLGKK